MLECWNKISFSNNWNQFRIAVCRCLNSMFAFMILCRKTVNVEVLTSYLLDVVKPSHRLTLATALLALKDDNSFEPLYKFLESVVATSPTPEYLSFYPRLFVLLVEFFAMDGKHEISYETVLLNLPGDLSLIQDISNQSSLEKKDYAKMLSIVSSIWIAPYHPCKVADESRSKYAAASYFLGTRLYYLLDVCKKDNQSTKFWHETPVPGYTLSDYLEESAAQIMKQNAHLFKLPAVTPISFIDDDDDIVLDSMDVDTEAVEVEETPPAVMRGSAIVPSKSLIPLGGLKVPELKALLLARGLPSTGNKDELKQALVNTGDFSYEARVKKRKFTKNSKTKRGAKEVATHPDGSSDTGDTD